MKGQEYIDATNLSKLRIAQAAILDCLFTGDQSANEALHIEVLEKLAIIKKDIESRVRKVMS